MTVNEDGFYTPKPTTHPGYGGKGTAPIGTVTHRPAFDKANQGHTSYWDNQTNPNLTPYVSPALVRDALHTAIKETFPSGAQRDHREGKGRFDLLPPEGLRRLAEVMENGAKKYGDRNWEKGMPVGRFLDSAFRHILQYIEGKTDEDHLGQAAWNLVAAISTEERSIRGVLPRELQLESRRAETAA